MKILLIKPILLTCITIIIFVIFITIDLKKDKEVLKRLNKIEKYLEKKNKDKENK